MPNFDGTGPRGMGSMTGRGLGKRNNKQEFGQGRGRGFGQGFGCRFAEYTTPQEKLEALKTYKKNLAAEIDALEKEIK